MPGVAGYSNGRFKCCDKCGGDGNDYPCTCPPVRAPRVVLAKPEQATLLEAKVEEPPVTEPVCKICKDTHIMHFEETGQDRMCTHCPLPCQDCRQGGTGPYCERTPCVCQCHRGLAPPTELQKLVKLRNVANHALELARQKVEGLDAAIDALGLADARKLDLNEAAELEVEP